jgi:hypothetical protein
MSFTKNKTMTKYQFDIKKIKRKKERKKKTNTTKQAKQKCKYTLFYLQSGLY